MKCKSFGSLAACSKYDFKGKGVIGASTLVLTYFIFPDAGEPPSLELAAPETGERNIGG